MAALVCIDEDLDLSGGEACDREILILSHQWSLRSDRVVRVVLVRDYFTRAGTYLGQLTTHLLAANDPKILELPNLRQEINTYFPGYFLRIWHDIGVALNRSRC